MANEVKEMKQVPKTREVIVTEQRNTKTHKFAPKKLFETEGAYESRGDPAYSDPTRGGSRRRRRTRTLVVTPQGAVEP